MANNMLFVDGFEETLKSLLNFINSLVNDGVVANFYTFTVGNFCCFAFRTDVVANNDSI